MKTYFPLVDVLRFFAAFWVMSFHYFLGLSGELSWYRYGNLGVPLFFIISGFVISLSVSGTSLKKFAFGRWLRLFPLFWIACTITYLFTLFFPSGNPVTFNEYALSMTMLGEKFINAFGYVRIVDPVYWSLLVELIFYAAIGLFVYLFSWKNIRYFTYAWFLISALSFLFGVDDTFIAKLLLVRHASYFLFGVTLSLIISTSYTSIKQKRLDYLSLVVFAVYGIFISQFALPPYFVINPLDTIVVTFLHVVFFVGMLLVVYLSPKITTSRFTQVCIVLGGITYPLYLIHQTIGVAILREINLYAKVTTQATVLMVGMISIAYLLYIFDKRVRAYLSHKLQPKETAISHSSLPKVTP